MEGLGIPPVAVSLSRTSWKSRVRTSIYTVSLNQKLLISNSPISFFFFFFSNYTKAVLKLCAAQRHCLPVFIEMLNFILLEQWTQTTLLKLLVAERFCSVSCSVVVPVAAASELRLKNAGLRQREHVWVWEAGIFSRKANKQNINLSPERFFKGNPESISVAGRLPQTFL